jgi:hypothetical protein
VAWRIGVLVLGGLGLIAAALAVLAVAQLAGRPAPRLAAGADLAADTVVVDRPELDLGRVPLGATVPVSVRLTNLSRRTILLGQATAEALEGC